MYRSEQRLAQFMRVVEQISMTITEQIAKAEKEAKRVKSRSSWIRDLYNSIFCVSIIQIVKEQQERIEELEKKVNKAEQGQ